MRRLWPTGGCCAKNKQEVNLSTFKKKNASLQSFAFNPTKLWLYLRNRLGQISEEINDESCSNVCLMQIQGFYTHKGYVLYWVYIKGFSSSGNCFYCTEKLSDSVTSSFLRMINVDRLSVLRYPLKLKI